MKSVINQLLILSAVTIFGCMTPLVATTEVSLVEPKPPIGEETMCEQPVCGKTHIPIANWSQGNQKFTTHFYSAVPAGMNENFVFSPISLQVNLSMVTELASGDTKLDLLHIAALPPLASARQRGALHIIESFNTMIEDWEGPLKLVMANKMWLSPETVPTKLTEGIIRDSYQSEISFLDFQSAPEEARVEINAWVDDKTLHQIPELMPEGSISPNSRAVLVNTLYMRSPWKKPFNPELTDEAPFFGLEKSLRYFPYMHQNGVFSYAEGANFQIIELPFADLPDSASQLSMIVVLPKAETTLEEVEFSLFSTPNTYSLLTKMSLTQVDLTLPKFKVSSTIDAKKTLQTMGLSLPFSEDAEFELSGDQKIAITDIIHQATLEINELGGVAAAGTGTTIGLTSIIDSSIEMVVNRPFMFFVIEKEEGIILFAGRIRQLQTPN